MDTKRTVETAALAIAAVALGALLWSRQLSVPALQAQGPVISAREFRVVDSRGICRGRLFVTDNDAGVILELNDVRGWSKVSFQAGPVGGFGLIWGPGGGGSYDTRFATPSINFLDANNMIQASLPWQGGVSGGKALQGFPALPMEPGPPAASSSPPGPGRSPQSVHPSEIESLRSYVDNLNSRVNAIAAQLNALR
jgi:hypothetical protein